MASALRHRHSANLSFIHSSPYFTDTFPYIADDKPYFTDDKPYIADDNPYIADNASSYHLDIVHENSGFFA